MAAFLNLDLLNRTTIFVPRINAANY